ncbi:hypothetical protein AB3X91_09145 [Paraburkholderia sp. BR14263]|uniref:hypothetical protein n=1 Tax=unclassified Paraburkholderia TaxID=2615204 RepID=UPI0034CE72AF
MSESEEIRAIHGRLKDGDERFVKIADDLSAMRAQLYRRDDAIRTHLHSQDDALAEMARKIDKVVDGTDSIVTMWSGGVRAVRLFCRLADLWRFFMRQVFFPILVPVLGVFGTWYYATYHRFPIWLEGIFKIVAEIK